MTHGPARLSRKDLSIGFLALLLIFAIWQDYLLPSSYTRGSKRLGGAPGWRNIDGAQFGKGYRPDSTVYKYDLVVSYYNEPLDSLAETISTVKEKLGRGSKRVIIYYKGEGATKELLKLADEVVPLRNIGREGGTYLSHIIRHYPNGELDFADHTIFLQPHLAWDWVMKPRLDTIGYRTGFLSLGPYINMTRGKDVHGNEFSQINDIYAIFRQDLSPPYSILATWAGQFVVSRQRIMDNTLKGYENLLRMFAVDKDHWIWKEGWWNNEPSNPTLGHALERSWPLIFDCTDARIAETCGEGSGPTCTCRD